MFGGNLSTFEPKCALSGNPGSDICMSVKEEKKMTLKRGRGRQGEKERETTKPEKERRKGRLFTSLIMQKL